MREAQRRSFEFDCFGVPVDDEARQRKTATGIIAFLVREIVVAAYEVDDLFIYLLHPHAIGNSLGIPPENQGASFACARLYP